MDSNNMENETTNRENGKTVSSGSIQGETSQNKEKDSVSDGSPSGTHTLSKPALAFSMLAGVLSVIIGVFSTASSFMYIMEDIHNNTNLDYNLARTGMMGFLPVALKTFFNLRYSLPLLFFR